jgi:biopolymer transport protein ExbB
MKKSVIPFLVLAASLQAQSFEEAAREASRKLETALSQLSAIQQEIGQKRPDLGARLDMVEDEALRLRDLASNAARTKATFDVEVNQLQKERQSVQDNNNYIRSTLLNEYTRRLETTINPAEIPLYSDAIRSTLNLLEAESDVDIATVFAAQLKVIELSLKRIESTIGGAQFEAEAIVQGTKKEGNFTLVGPVSYFSSADGTAGITDGMASNRANIYLLPQSAPGIIELNTRGSGIIPVDTTRGEALAGITHSVTLVQEIKMGGFVMWPILTLFGLAIIIAIFKFFELLRIKPADSRDIDTILEKLAKNDTQGALAHAKSVSGPVGEMLCAAVENADKDKEVIEEVLYETIIKTQPRLERFLAFIAVTAATAPLLGLLGTVTGMIKTFKLITIVGTGDAKNLSSGISEALITTKWGLIVAIPTLIVHALLNRKAKGVVGSMEQAAVSFINGIAEQRGETEEAA